VQRQEVGVRHRRSGVAHDDLRLRALRLVDEEGPPGRRRHVLGQRRRLGLAQRREHPARELGRALRGHVAREADQDVAAHQGPLHPADGVDFVYVYPNKTDSAAGKVAFHKEKQLAGALVDDQGARIAALLRAQRTAEAFVVDRDHKLVYHGAIDDDRGGQKVSRRHLAIAIEEMLAGKQVSEAKTPVHA
jgi:hypothetical protein